MPTLSNSCGAVSSFKFQAILSNASCRPSFAVDKISRPSEARINEIRKFPGAPRFVHRGLKSIADFVFLRSSKGALPEIRTDLFTLANWAFPFLCASTARERAAKILSFLASSGFAAVRSLGGGEIAVSGFSGLLAFSGSRRVEDGQRFISVPANLPEIAYPYLSAEHQRRALEGADVAGADRTRLKGWQRERVNAWLAKRIGDNELALLSALDKAAYDRSASLVSKGIRDGMISSSAVSVPVSSVAFSAADGIESASLSQASARRLMIAASRSFMALLRNLSGEAASQIWASLRRLEDLGLIEVVALMSAGGTRRIGISRILLTNAAMEIFFGIPFNLARLAALVEKLRSILPKRRRAASCAAPQPGFAAQQSAAPAFQAARSPGACAQGSPA